MDSNDNEIRQYLKYITDNMGDRVKEISDHSASIDSSLTLTNVLLSVIIVLLIVNIALKWIKKNLRNSSRNRECCEGF